MTLEQLKVLKAIIKHGSFKSASTSLNRSQPAISIAIRNLEKELGFKIFSRAHLRALLTEKGEAFHQKSVKILDEIEKLENFSKYISNGFEHTVKIGVEVLCNLSIFNPVFSGFPDRYSDTKFEISFLQVGESVDHLLEGKIDLAISSLVKKNSKVEEVPFAIVNMLPVISKNHPLAQENDGITDSELRQYAQITFDRPGKYSISEQFGRVENSSLWETCDLNQSKQLIMEGVGWGYLPQNMILGELEKGNLVRLRSPSKRQQRILLKGLRKASNVFGKIKSELWDNIRILGTSNVHVI